MRQFLLAVMLIAIPATAFAIFQIFLATAPASVPAASLGDLSNLKTIVADVQKIAETGDLAAAKERIADFETAWDDAEATMRPLNEAGWGHVDDAADAWRPRRAASLLPTATRRPS